MRSESAAELFGRLQGTASVANQPPVPVPVFLDHLKNGHLYQVSGECGSGKSQFLLTLTAHCVMPASCGGLEAAVVWLDCDLKFSVFRFITLLESRIRALSSQSAISQPAATACTQRLLASRALVEQALQRFMLIRCFTHDDLLFAFDRIDQLMYEQQQPPVVLLCLDSVGAFHNQFDSPVGANKAYDKSTARLQQFLCEHRQLTAVASCRRLRKHVDADKENQAGDTCELFDTMNRTWHQSVTATFHLERLASNDCQAIGVRLATGHNRHSGASSKAVMAQIWSEEHEVLVITEAGVDHWRRNT